MVSDETKESGGGKGLEGSVVRVGCVLAGSPRACHAACRDAGSSSVAGTGISWLALEALDHPTKWPPCGLRMLISLQMFSAKPQAPTALTPSPPSQSIAKGKTKKAEPFLTRQGGMACRVDPQRGSPESPQGHRGEHHGRRLRVEGQPAPLWAAQPPGSIRAMETGQGPSHVPHPPNHH